MKERIAITGMGIVSAIGMNAAETETLEGIITGTGMGCIQDSEKFLDKLIAYDEQYLTPTSFIQSTHNTVGGQIALGLKCKAYNFTYVNTGGSFPSALLDGMMHVKHEDKNNILVGGVDEIADYTYKLYQTIDHFKSDDESSYNILENRSKGSVSAEGSTFFILDAEKKKSTYAEIVDTHTVSRLKEGRMDQFFSDFLAKNEMELKDIDVVLLGNNGDIDFDFYYDKAEEEFTTSNLIYYKHLFGEFMTVPAVSVWVGANILKHQRIPSVLYKNKKEGPKNIGNVLIYNQYRGRDHSLILMKNV